MKVFAWDPQKNDLLRQERGVSFEEVAFHIENGDLLDEIEHPNLGKYAQQRMFIVRMENYAYLVPFVLTGDEVYLKTIIPSRKATRLYLGDADEEDKIG